jgi:ketosteroid isomerase-like protein
MPGWEITVTTDTEALVRRAYHLAEGDVLDVQGFIDLFAEDGVFNGIGGVSGQESYRGEQLGDVVVWMGKMLPDVHRELHRVNVLGDVVAIELSIRGTFLGPFETPAGVIQPTGAKLDIPTADFWYVRDGKLQEFNCHIGMTTMFAQLGVLSDFASAVAASAPER